VLAATGGRWNNNCDRCSKISGNTMKIGAGSGGGERMMTAQGGHWIAFDRGMMTDGVIRAALGFPPKIPACSPAEPYTRER
jgi:hypothetical protein